MSGSGTAVLRSVAAATLSRRAKNGALSVAAHEAYEDLVRVLAPVIGQSGVEAITARALHVARGEHVSASTPTAEAGDAGGFSPIMEWLEQQEADRIAEAAATLFAEFGNLLVTFIGEPLTMRLTRKAWPEGFLELDLEEERGT